METVDNPSSPQRSTFVTVTGWLFLSIGAIMTIFSLIQALMYVRMLSMPTMHQAMHEGAKHLPFLLQLIFDHFRLYIFLVFSLSFATFLSAIGLIKRSNMARRLFIVILTVSVLGMLAAFITQLSISPATNNIPNAQIPKEAKNMLRAMKGFQFILTFSFSCLIGWIIARLSTPEILAEFTKTNSPTAQ